MSAPYDLVIVGGGPAGMSAALVAGRARLRTLVLNDEKPRNRVAPESHGFLTRDGVAPMELLRLAKEQLAKYPRVEYQKAALGSISRATGGFRLEFASGAEVRASRIVFATGQRDEPERLGLPGLREVYGTSVHPCPFCDGFEHGDERIAIFGAAGVARFAALLKLWSADVAVFTNGRTLDAEEREALRRNGVGVFEDEVLSLDSKDGRLVAVRLPSGAVARDAGFLWDRMAVPASDAPAALGVPRKDGPLGVVTYEADEMGRTAVPGVFVVGDLRTGFSKVAHAVSDGARCVEHIVHEIAQERWS